MNQKNKTQTVMIGIPTCYGGESLVDTIKSIKSTDGSKDRQIVIVADRTPISEKHQKILKEMGVKLIWNKIEGSQFKKLKQLIAECSADIFVFTQDDITFDKNAISQIVKDFEDNPEVTMIGSRILPLPSMNLVEKSLTSMVRIVDYITRFWNNGNNYLSASGRCISFRTSAIKKFNIRENIVNGDMYLYLENKKIGGKFMQSKKSIVKIRCPQNLKDQIGPSSRFQFSKTELTKYFDFDINKEYQIPFTVIIKAFISELLTHPVSAAMYLIIFIYTRVYRQSFSTLSPMWRVDTSTKN